MQRDSRRREALTYRGCAKKSVLPGPGNGDSVAETPINSDYVLGIAHIVDQIRCPLLDPQLNLLWGQFNLLWGNGTSP